MLEDQINVSVVETAVAVLPEDVLGLQMVLSGHARKRAGDKVGQLQITFKSHPSLAHLQESPGFIHKATTCLELHLLPQAKPPHTNHVHETRSLSHGHVYLNLRWKDTLSTHQRTE